MNYKVKYSERAVKELKKLDKTIRQMIYNWIDKNLNDCENPKIQGKSLNGNLSGLWRYRIGDYRIICDIDDIELIILALTVGHRRKIYKKN